MVSATQREIPTRTPTKRPKYKSVSMHPNSRTWPDSVKEPQIHTQLSQSWPAGHRINPTFWGKQKCTSLTHLLLPIDPFVRLNHHQSISLSLPIRIKNNLSPAWTRTFETSFIFGKETKFNVGIFDEVSKTGRSISMGSACFEIGEILGARGNIKAKKLKNGGTVFARVTRAMTTNAGTLTAQFTGVKLKNVEGMFSKSDPFFVISSQSNDPAGRTWHPVYRSETIMNNLNPAWKPFSVSVENLCKGDKDKPILIEVFDWEKSGKHQTMGSIQTTLNALIFLVGGSERKLTLMHKKQGYGFIQVESAAISGEGTTYTAASMAAGAARNVGGTPPKKFVKINGITKINPEYKAWKDAQESGKAAVPAPTTAAPLSAPATTAYQPSDATPAFGQALNSPPPVTPIPPALPPPTRNEKNAHGVDNKPKFVDYVAGGTEINLVVAIDYTGSNGDPRKPGTLHYIHRDGQLNDYEKALTAVGAIVARYDSDQQFPVLGEHFPAVSVCQ